MQRLDSWAAAIVCAAAVAVVGAGCGGSASEDTADPVTGAGYPEWVRIVPQASDEASYFVGAVSRARDIEEGSAAAEADAIAQAIESQRREFIQLYDSAAAESGVETTSEQRLQFRTRIADEMADSLRPAASREDTYYRYCDDEGGTVCELFVLIRLDHGERDRIFREVLGALGQRRQREGDADTAVLIEWMLRNL